MALSASTAAQRAELQAACNMAGKYLHKFEEDGFLRTGNTALIAEYQAYLDRVQAALTAIADAE
jgi:hypothetical protein